MRTDWTRDIETETIWNHTQFLQDPFNVTQTWLDLNGFEYDELLVVDGPEAKVHVLLVLLFNMIVRRPCPAFLVEGFILDYLAVTKVQAGRLKPKRIGKLSLLLTGCAPFHPVHTGGWLHTRPWEGGRLHRKLRVQEHGMSLLHPPWGTNNQSEVHGPAQDRLSLSLTIHNFLPQAVCFFGHNAEPRRLVYPTWNFLSVDVQSLLVILIYGMHSQWYLQTKSCMHNDIKEVGMTLKHN